MADLQKISQLAAEVEYQVPGKIKISQLAAEVEYTLPADIAPDDAYSTTSIDTAAWAGANKSNMFLIF